MTSCLRKTNCRKTCFYCQQNHHYLFCKLPATITCSEYMRKQFLKEVARKGKVNKQNTEKKPEYFTFSSNFTLSDGKFSMESWLESSKLIKRFNDKNNMDPIYNNFKIQVLSALTGTPQLLFYWDTWRRSQMSFD